MSRDTEAENVEQGGIEFKEPVSAAFILTCLVWAILSVATFGASVLIWMSLTGEVPASIAFPNAPWWVRWPGMSVVAAFGIPLTLGAVLLLLDASRELMDILGDGVSAFGWLVRTAADAWKEVYDQYVR